MTSPAEEIKDRLNLVETVQGYVRLQKAGKNWKGLCPFHTEKTPSFNVSPDKEMWYCFGCGEGGDLFTFIERIEGIEFPDALRMLADKAGVKLKKEDPKVRSRRQQLYEIVELATKFFEKQLAESNTGKKVQEYLKDRGLKSVTIDQWRLGYAPDDWRTLYDFLRGKKYSDKAIEAAGLSVKTEKKTAKHPYHDRFRHRITFPIFDSQGSPVGFSGRVFEEIAGKTVGKDAGKYINTPNTLIYDKSGVLYGLDRARDDIKAQENVVVVEGNLDVILAHQAGTKNVVATSGTALAARHLRILKRCTDKLIIAFDADEAGERATLKGAELAGPAGFGVSIVKIPKGKDVADLVSKSDKKWKDALEKKIPFIQFVIEKAVKKHNPSTAEGKKSISHEVLFAISTLSSPVEQEHWIGELAGVINTSEQALQREFTLVRNRQVEPLAQDKDESQAPQEETPRLALEEYFLAMLANYPKGVGKIGDSLDLIQSEEIRGVIEKSLKTKKDVASLVVGQKKFVQILARASFLDEIVENEEDEFNILLNMLKRRSVKEKLKNIEQDLKKAEQAGDGKKAEVLLSEFNNLSKELLQYESR